MDIVWDGITRATTLSEDACRVRHELANAAKSYEWTRVFQLLTEHGGLINSTRPDGTSWFAPLHQAAHGGAAVEVVQRLLHMGAWRALQDARGERPVDLAERQGHRHLLRVLAPERKHHVPPGVLLKIQAHFHGVIRGRADQLVGEQGLRLPELEPLLELDRPEVWFPVPGMYGGFKYKLEAPGGDAKLVCESWCRVADGSGERHVITSSGSRMLEDT